MSLLFGNRYLRKVRRSSGLVACYLGNESSGLVSIDSSGHGYDGVYDTVTLGQPGVPRLGMSSVAFDGINSFNNIYSAGFANDNLLLNPGFETAGGGGADIWANWTETAGDGALANEAVVIHQGADAAKFTAGATKNTLVYQSFAVTPGEEYRIRFWTRGNGVAAGRYYVIDVTNSAYIIPYGRTTGVSGAVYTMVEDTFVAPPTCVMARLYLQCSATLADITYYDACEVRRTNGFLGDKGTIIVPAQVANAGVWTDGAVRCVVRVGGASDYAVIRRSAVNNQLDWGYVAGGVGNWINEAGVTELGFMSLGITWDISAGATGQVIGYRAGEQVGVTGVNLGTWQDDLAATGCNIGSLDQVPQQVFDGPIGPVPVFNEALTPDEMLHLGSA